MGWLSDMSVCTPFSFFCPPDKTDTDSWLCTDGLGHLNFLAPPDWALRWIEGTLKLRAWLPYYVSVDQKTYGRFGVLPMADLNAATVGAPGMPGLVGANQRLGASPE